MRKPNRRALASRFIPVRRVGEYWADWSSGAISAVPGLYGREGRQVFFAFVPTHNALQLTSVVRVSPWLGTTHRNPALRERYSSSRFCCRARRPHAVGRPAGNDAGAAALDVGNEPHHGPGRRRLYGCRRRVHAGDDRAPRAGYLHVAPGRVPRRESSCSSSRPRSISRRWPRSASCSSGFGVMVRPLRIRRRGGPCGWPEC